MNTAIPKKLNKKENPWFLGVYANLARHNVFIILTELSHKMPVKFAAPEEGKLEEADIIQFLNPEKRGQYPDANKPVIVERVINSLYHHFPFLHSLNGKVLDAQHPHPENYFKVLYTLLNTLRTHRNYYTHAIHAPQPFPQEIVKWMNLVFDANIFEAKERLDLTGPEGESHVKHLRYQIGKDLNPNFKYWFDDEDGNITEKGLAFFFCFFLEKDYAVLMLKKLKDFKAGKEKWEQATIISYTLSCCRLPKPKLESSKSNTELMLNMLQELQRCPIQLYETLSEENKQKFITRIDEEAEDPEADTILIRKQDRFPYFALRYIDENELFQKLRFQVDLGKLIFKNYKKKLDGVEYMRRWEKRLLSFGRLQEVDLNKQPEEWKLIRKDPSQIDDNTPAPYLIETNSHYNFEHNNIAIKDTRVKNNNKLFILWPDVMNGKPSTEEPDYFMCVDELPGLVFYNLLAEKYKHNTKAEDLIINHMASIKKFLSAVQEGHIIPITKQRITRQRIASGFAELLGEEEFETEYNTRKEKLEALLNEYNLKFNMIPESIAKYLLGIEPVENEERSRKIIQLLIEDTSKRLERLEPGDQKPTKKQIHSQIRRAHTRAGELAMFLAKDMMLLQPYFLDEFGRPTGKPNADEFQILQWRLAYFGGEKKLLPSTFRMCNLIDSRNEHPFLNNINLDNCKTNLDFYKAYLKARKVYLLNCLTDKNIASLQFLKIGQDKCDSTYFRELAARISAKPVNLPRGLFKGAIVSLLSKKGSERIKQLLFEKDNNIVFLVEKYFEENGDLHQPFYHYKRSYRNVDKHFDDRKEGKEKFKGLKQQYLTSSELAGLANQLKIASATNDEARTEYNFFRKDVIENEKLIRHMRMSDQILFLMCKDQFAKDEVLIRKSLDESFLLKDIYPDSPKSILNKEIEFEIPLLEKIIYHKFKIKNYGKFRRFLKDRRLPSLLEYFQKERLSVLELEKQLKDYEKFRLRIFQTIYEFELACSKDLRFETVIENEMKKPNKKGIPQNYVEHKPLLKESLKLLPSKQNLDEEIMLNIRNKFSHNQFPQVAVFKKIISNDSTNYAGEFAQYAEYAYNLLQQNIEQVVMQTS